MLIKKNYFKKFRKDLLLVVLLLGLAIFAWKDVPKLVIRGDGFVYMMSWTMTEFFNRTYWFTGYGFETSAVLLGSVLPKIFKTNMTLYFYLSLSLMMVINALFYILLRFITKNKAISFIIALLFAVNYFGNFDMYSQHCYCYITERVISVPLLLPAFLFLHLYLEKNNKKYFFISIAIYFIAIGMVHFALLFTAPYLVYPFFWQLFSNKNVNMRNILNIKALIGLLYLGISGLFSYLQIIYIGTGGKYKMTDYLLHPEIYHYPEKIIREFAHWAEYKPVIVHFFTTTPIYRFVDIKSAEESTLYVVFVYLIAAVFIYKKLPRQRALLFTTLIGTTMIFFLNAWFGQYSVLSQPGANRYLYFPTFLLVIFWGLLMWVLWKSSSRYLKAGVLILVSIYYFINVSLISGNFSDVFRWDRSTKLMFEHMASMRSRLSKNTLVVAPDPEVWVYESAFFTEQIGRGEVEYITNRNPSRDWVKVASSSSIVIKLSYNENCDCIKEEKIK